jgi:hypothetical protein
MNRPPEALSLACSALGHAKFERAKSLSLSAAKARLQRARIHPPLAFATIDP